jgi:hypothetical protein
MIVPSAKMQRPEKVTVRKQWYLQAEYYAALEEPYF